MRALCCLVVIASMGLASMKGERAASPGLASPTSASTVHRDPVTGRFGPPTGPAPSAPLSRLSTSTAGLTEVPGPRGGWLVRLGERFQNQVQATRVDGAISAECRSAGEEE